MYENKTINHFRKLLLFSGIFNILLATPLIIPVFYEKYFLFLWYLNELFYLGGKMPIPPGEGINALLINTAGIDLVLIGSIVIYASFDPIKRMTIALLNAVGRSIFAFIIVYYVVVFDIARIALVIGFIDILISSAFIYYYLKLKK